MNRSEMWFKIYKSAVRAGHAALHARQAADVFLEKYDERFPQQEEESTSLYDDGHSIYPNKT